MIVDVINPRLNAAFLQEPLQRVAQAPLYAYHVDMGRSLFIIDSQPLHAVQRCESRIVLPTDRPTACQELLDLIQLSQTDGGVDIAEVKTITQPDDVKRSGPVPSFVG